ncbi:MAG: energy transducer TonB [Arenimonas sp.]|nr:energy transducer TonB [Arenimonas sp.]MBP6626838.1 energy transducer TonB [Arenimonas sp.]
MPRHRQSAAALALLLSCLAGCSEPGAPAAASATAAAQAPSVAAAAPAERRALAERALSAQRIYAPAGDSAIEHFLQLREDGGADASVETALLELLPYAVIGSEQAMARQDLPEARRLVALIERIDAQLPSLVRLKAALADADRAAAEAVIAQAEAAKQRLLQAEREAELAAAASAPAVASRNDGSAQAAPVPAPVLAALPPAPPAVPVAAPVVATTPVPSNDPSPASVGATAAAPVLLSAPPPRYPLTALRRKLEGDVTVAFTIQPDGSVASPRVVAATKPGLFDQAALAATSRWRFQAGAAPTEVTRQLRFRLDTAGQQAATP